MLLNLELQEHQKWYKWVQQISISNFFVVVFGTALYMPWAVNFSVGSALQNFNCHYDHKIVSKNIATLKFMPSLD